MPVTARPIITAAHRNRAPLQRLFHLVERGDGTRQVLSQLTALVAETTKIRAHRIDPEADFEEHGLDSNLITRAQQEAEAITGVSDSTLLQIQDLVIACGFSGEPSWPRFHSEGSSPAATNPFLWQKRIREVAARPATPARNMAAACRGRGYCHHRHEWTLSRCAGSRKLLGQSLPGVDSITEHSRRAVRLPSLLRSRKGKAGHLYCKWAVS